MNALTQNEIQQVAAFLYNNLNQNASWIIPAAQAEMASVAKRWLKETAEAEAVDPTET